MAKNTREKYRVLIDTNILFSAINYPSGNEAQLFSKADQGYIEILIIDYVIDELKGVFKEYGIDSVSITNFLDTYRNIQIIEYNTLYDDKKFEYAKKIIADIKDIPIFRHLCSSPIN